MIRNNTGRISHEYHSQSLSTFWSQSQTNSSCQQLSFFGKGITYIDRLYWLDQQILSNVKQLDLSHNAISKLDNIKQFKNVEIVNLSHNHITDGRSILKLSKLNKLRTVMVKGNPFLSSKQGELEALKFLVTKNCDLAILTKKQEDLITDIIDITKRIYANINYLQHIQINIEFIREFQVEINEGIESNRNRIIQSILNEYVEDHMDISHNIREQLFMRVLVQGEEENIGELDQVLARQRNLLDDELQKIGREIIETTTTMKNVRNSELNQRRSNKNLLRISQHRQTNQNLRQATIDTKQNDYFISETSHNPKTSNQFYSMKKTEQKFQSYYTNMLRKHNPVYQLLYSPLHSLNNNEKDLLIQTMSVHLREKSFQLFQTQRVKNELNKTRKLLEDKEKDFIESENKFIQYKKCMTETITLLQNAKNEYQCKIKQMQQSIKSYEQSNTSLVSKLSYISQQLSQKKLIEIKHKHLLDKYSQSEQIQQKIRQNQNNNLLRQMLNKFRMRANKMHIFHSQMKKIQITKEQQIMVKYFKEFKYNKQFEYFIRNMRKQVQYNCSKTVIRNFIANSSISLRTKSLRTLLMDNYQHEFIENLKIVQMKNVRMKLLLENSRQLHMKKLAKLCLTQWKYQSQSKRQQKLQETADEFHSNKLLSHTFINWQIYMKQPMHKQAEIRVDLTSKIVKNFFVQLHKQLMQTKMVKQKMLNLIVFLNKHRRIVHLTRFRRVCTLERMRLDKKICMYLKLKRTKCLQQLRYFIRKETDHKNQQYCKSQKLRRILRKNNLRDIRMQEFKGKTYTDILHIIFHKYRIKAIHNRFIHSMKLFAIQDNLNKNSAKHFFLQLHQQHLSNLKLTNHFYKLKAYLETNNPRETYLLSKQKFFKYLRQPIIDRKRFINFMSRKYQKKLLHYFMDWRVYNYRNQVKQWQIKMSELGSEIEEVQLKQKTVFEEKTVLIGIIDNKQKEINALKKQLDQANFYIQMKQAKYNKLRNLYVIDEQTDMLDSKPILIQDSIIPERDFDTFFSSESNKDPFATFSQF